MVVHSPAGPSAPGSVVRGSVLMAVAVQAQVPATEFSDVPDRLSIGDSVVVTTTGGQTIEGKIAGVAATALVLRQGSEDRPLASSDVQRIVHQRHGVRNGAWLGLAIGFAAGATLAAGADDCEFTCLSSPRGMAIIGGIGYSMTKLLDEMKGES